MFSNEVSVLKHALGLRPEMRDTSLPDIPTL
jgi:hypothetical protein